MNKKNTLLKFVFSCLLSVLMGFYVSAQKLPSIQQISLRAPKNVKVDGKVTEWSNQFQAFNHNIDVYYTVANDGDKLYLIIQAKDASITKKIIAGGITLTINNTGKKDEQDNVTLISPKLNSPTQSTLGDYYSQIKSFADSKANARQIDSLLTLANGEIIANGKEIKVTGVKAIADTMVSVYNEHGIKAVMRFDNYGALNYEMAIPLKYLNIAQQKLFYNVTLGGFMANAKRVNSRGSGVVSATTIPNSLINTRRIDYEIMNNPTDFWGEYTLAK